MKAFVVAIAGAWWLAPQPDLNAVRDRLDRYLLDYEPQLSALVADEELFQDDTYRLRTIHSEVAFIGLPGNSGWLGFRRVVKVGGKAVKDAGPPLAQLLTDGAKDDYDQARLLLEQSASQNLGSPRTINLPNLPLELLHPRHRHQFKQRSEMNEKIDGHETVRVLFEETSMPSIIGNPASGDAQSLVTAWIEPDTGRLRRAEVRTKDRNVVIGNPFQPTIWVSFKEDPKVGILVPTEMREQFFVQLRRSGRGVAKYSNYRRFQTSARIVPPGEG
jgi:hypothetical protein